MSLLNSLNQQTGHDDAIIVSLLKPKKGKYQIRYTPTGVYLHKLDQNGQCSDQLIFIRDEDIIAVNTAKTTKNILIIYALNQKRDRTKFYIFMGDEEEISEFLQKLRKVLSLPSKSRHIAVLLNPIGGKKIAKKLFRKCLKPMLKRVGIKFDYFETDSAEYIDHWVQKTDIRKYSEVVCVGGDGLVNQYLNAIYLQPSNLDLLKIPIGIIPAGSQNALACSLSGKNPMCAAANIIRQRDNSCDIMKIRLDDRVILATTAISWGILSDISSTAESWRIFGPARYTICGARKLLTPMKQYRTTVTYTLSDPRDESNHQKMADLDLKSASLSMASVIESQKVTPHGKIENVNVPLEDPNDSGLDVEEHLADRKEIMVHQVKTASQVRVPKTSGSDKSNGSYALLGKDGDHPDHDIQGDIQDTEAELITFGQNEDSRKEIHADDKRKLPENFLMDENSDVKIVTEDELPGDQEDNKSGISDLSHVDLCVDNDKEAIIVNPLEFSYRMPPIGEKTVEIDTSITILSIVNHTVRSSLGEDIYSPQGSITDGNLDMILLPRANKCSIIRFLTGIRNKGSHLKSKKVVYQKLKAIKIEPQMKLAFNIDGEHYHSKSVKVDVLPGLAILYGIPV